MIKLSGKIMSLTFLHISDLHYKEETYDTKILFDEFLNDIDAWRKKYNNDQAIDFIFITGDIAYTGIKSEYEIAQEKIKYILETTGCSKNNVFVVPGNHDLDRNKISMDENTLREKVKVEKNGLEQLFKNYTNYKLLLNKFQDYNDFINNIGNPNIIYNPVNGNLDPWYSKRITLNGLSIRIIGLNTALLVDKNENNIDMSIYTMVYQLKKLMTDYDPDEHIIVLTHHPNDMLFGDENLEVESLMGKHHMLHLYGHTHSNQTISKSFSQESNYLSLAAGCLYSKHELINSYMIGAIDFTKNKLQLWPRRWYHSSLKWRENPEWGDLDTIKSLTLDLPGRNVENVEKITRTVTKSSRYEIKNGTDKEKSPFSVIITANPETILVGGDTTLLTAQLCFNGLPCNMSSVKFNFSSDNDVIANLPKVKTYITDVNGRVTIPLTSNELPGCINVTVVAKLDNFPAIKEEIKNIPITSSVNINLVEWGALTGTVYDLNGVGIPYATVTLWKYELNPLTNYYEITRLVRIPENPQQSNDGRTSRIGRYSFHRVPSGYYCVTAEKEGHHYFSLVNIIKGTYTNDIVIHFVYMPPR